MRGKILGATALQFSSFGDLDADGDLDILMGDLNYAINYIENIGTPTAPAFGARIGNPFGISINYSLSFPALGDMDGDNDLDLWIGQPGNGNIMYYENTGTANQPAFGTPQQVPIRGFPQGMYLTRIRAGERGLQRKFVVE